MLHVAGFVSTVSRSGWYESESDGYVIWGLSNTICRLPTYLPILDIRLNSSDEELRRR